ncbi:MAG: STAS domain-containing protein [Chloroflexota bacterium]
MSDEIEVSVRWDGDIAVIDLVGDVTTFAEEAINEAYRSVSTAGAKTIIFNFRENDYINSAGIAIMIGVITQARKRDQRLLFTGLSTHFQIIFRNTGLTQYADPYRSVGEAIGSLNKELQIPPEVTVHFDDSTAIVGVAGNITECATKPVKKALQTALEKSIQNIIFDFHDYEFVDNNILFRLIQGAGLSERCVFITGFSRAQIENTFISRYIDSSIGMYPVLKEALEAIHKGVQVTLRLVGKSAIIDVIGDFTILAKTGINKALQTARENQAANIIFNFCEYDYINHLTLLHVFRETHLYLERFQRLLCAGLNAYYQAKCDSCLEYVEMYPLVEEALNAVDRET